MIDPTPIPETNDLLIPWPKFAPLSVSVTAEGLKEAWDAIVPKFSEGRQPQSIEERIIMGCLRAVYDGMHGITSTYYLGENDDIAQGTWNQVIQEVVEDAQTEANRLYPDHPGYASDARMRQAFVAGANWTADRLFSGENEKKKGEVR